jgi:maltooligosyltrehalose trehalohydrolase
LVSDASIRRRIPVGAEVQPEGGVHFRAWAPASGNVAVVVEAGESMALSAAGAGYFEGLLTSARAGTRYRFRLSDGNTYPDPASRFQPEGPFGPSEVIDPGAFVWTDRAWSGLSREGQVVYEMHVGTFTAAGTFQAAAERLSALADLGITIIEIMPLADFAGRFGWGYDGVNLFAPTRLYGRPDDLRRFVARAHALGLGVIVDVVYNHFGPAGCYLDRFSPDYFSKEETDWGRAINFDGRNSAEVRAFYLANAQHWIEEYHFDGLRLDASQNIIDTSSEHILAAVTRVARGAAGARGTWMVAENEPQDARYVRSRSEGGYGVDAMWNDDFHHAAIVALTGRREAYYTDYRGTPQEFVACAKSGFLFQGQRYLWQKQPRGTLTEGVPACAFVGFLQNHDQVANSAWGDRLDKIAAPGCVRAMTALLLLGPWTPQLFQGQEFAASTPFQYFADHEPDLAEKVTNGRREFLAQFPSLRSLPDMPLPNDPATFERSKLNHAEREQHGPALALHRTLLDMRRRDPAFASQGAFGVDGAVLGERIFILRFPGGRRPRTGETGDRLLLVNLGPATLVDALSDPLLAHPHRREWHPTWSSEDTRFGGAGAAFVMNNQGWHVPAESAWVFE